VGSGGIHSFRNALRYRFLRRTGPACRFGEVTVHHNRYNNIPLQESLTGGLKGIYADFATANSDFRSQRSYVLPAAAPASFWSGIPAGTGPMLRTTFRLRPSGAASITARYLGVFLNETGG
jgi:hypothetical protein